MTTPSDDSRHEDFLRLFTASEGSLRAFVRSLVPTVADANDVMQEVTVVLWQKFGEYGVGEDFRRWAFGGLAVVQLTTGRSTAPKGHRRHQRSWSESPNLRSVLEKSAHCPGFLQAAKFLPSKPAFFR